MPVLWRHDSLCNVSLHREVRDARQFSTPMPPILDNFFTFASMMCVIKGQSWHKCLLTPPWRVRRWCWPLTVPPVGRSAHCRQTAARSAPWRPSAAPRRRPSALAGGWTSRPGPRNPAGRCPRRPQMCPWRRRRPPDLPSRAERTESRTGTAWCGYQFWLGVQSLPACGR